MWTTQWTSSAGACRDTGVRERCVEISSTLRGLLLLEQSTLNMGNAQSGLSFHQDIKSGVYPLSPPFLSPCLIHPETQGEHPISQIPLAPLLELFSPLPKHSAVWR